MVTTVKDLAERAGVTPTTISLCFQEGSRISDKTRKRILELAEELEYVPNLAARQLRNGKSKSKTLGMLVNDITNPFYAMMTQVAEKIAAQKGYDLIVADSRWSAKKEIAELEHFIKSRTDGVLACLSEKTDESIPLLSRFAMPYLVIDTTPANYDGAYVINDSAESAKLGANHLIDIGCTKPIFLNAEKELEAFSAFETMKDQFAKTCRERGIEFTYRNIVNGGLTIRDGLNSYAKILDSVPDFDGVFCVNTLSALGILEAAQTAGHNPAVMGVDDLDVCQLSYVSLTTIREPHEQLAQIATDVLINSIEEKTQPKVKMSLKPELMIRKSTQR